MLILALDSCGAACSVCVWQDGKVLSQTHEAMERGQDARLMPMIVSTLDKSGFTFADLDKIAVTRGPGSFTGARVGLATAIGVGLAAQKPAIGIDRFAIYHALHKSDKNLLVVIESKRAELFCRFFPAHDKAHAPCLMADTEIKNFILSHPDTEIVTDKDSDDGKAVTTCAALAATADASDAAFQPRPLYLRAPDVSFAAAKSR